MAAAGLRERKKRETRTALRTAALRLTAERGLDGVTVEAIAEAADVSPRTFFNYFSSKEEAIIGGDTEVMAGFIALVVARPANEKPLLALQFVLGGIAATFAEDREGQLLRRQVLAANPSLLPRHFAVYVEFERLLVEAITRRSRTSKTAAADASLVVASAVTALRVSVDLWLDKKNGPGLPQVFDRAIGRLAAGLL